MWRLMLVAVLAGCVEPATLATSCCSLYPNEAAMSACWRGYLEDIVRETGEDECGELNCSIYAYTGPRVCVAADDVE
jgi:hypothetical protein